MLQKLLSLLPGGKPTGALKRIDINHIVGSSLSAPTDGSEARYQVLCDRARGTLAHQLDWLGANGRERRLAATQLEDMLEAERPNMVLDLKPQVFPGD